VLYRLVDLRAHAERFLIERIGGFNVPNGGRLLHALLGQLEVFVVQISSNILRLEIAIERAYLFERFGCVSPFLHLVGLDGYLVALL
jgi:hypothetical protein